MTKKIISRLIIAVMALSLFPQQLFAAEGVYAETKTISVNVAQGKSFTVQNEAVSGGANRFGYLLDGDDSIERSHPDWDSETGFKNATVIVDLGRRYEIERIYMKACNGGGGEVCVGNQADGSDKEKIADIDWGDFNQTSDTNTVLGRNQTYQYVTVTAGANRADFFEMYVYTNMTVTEVSRNMTATASGVINEDFSAEKAVNGTNSASTDGWMGDYGKYSWWKLDFGEGNEQHIAYIEMEGRNTSSDPAARMNFALYGANGDVETNDTSADISGATELLRRGGSAFPEYNASNPENTKFATMIDDSTAYRYIVYKKTTAGPAEIGEFRAYVINPTVVDYTASGRDITITFSEAMKEQTIADIKIMSRNENGEVEKTVTKIDSCKYKLTMNTDMLGDSLTVDVSGAKNLKNVFAYSASEIVYNTPSAMDIDSVGITAGADVGAAILTAIGDAQEAGVKVKFTNNLTQASDIPSTLLVAALFDSDNTMVLADEFRKVYDPSESREIYVGLDLAQFKTDNNLTDLTGYTLRFFVWNNFAQMTPWVDSMELN